MRFQPQTKEEQNNPKASKDISICRSRWVDQGPKRVTKDSCRVKGTKIACFLHENKTLLGGGVRIDNQLIF